MNVGDVPGEKIVERLKDKYPNIPIIGISESGMYSNNYGNGSYGNHNLTCGLDAFVTKRRERGQKTFTGRDLLTCMKNLGFKTNLDKR